MLAKNAPTSATPCAHSSTGGPKGTELSASARRRGRWRLVAAYVALSSLAILAFDPLATATATKTLGLSVVALAACVLGRRRTSAPRRLGYADLAGLTFLGLSALSLTWGTLGGLVDLTPWFSATILVVALRRLPLATRFRIFEGTAMTAGTTSALVAVGQRLTHREVTGGHGNPDWLGLLLAVALPACFDVARRARRKRAVMFVPLLLVAAALYLSHSRVGWGAAVVSLAAMLLAAKRNAGEHAASFALVPTVGGHLGGFQEADTARAYAGRLWIWEHSARAALDRPLVGHGLGRFGFAYLDAQGDALSRLAPPEAARRFVNATTAHDDYLQIACESGFPTLVAFTVFLVRSAIALVRRSAFGAFGTFVAFAVCALGDSPARVPACVLVLGLAFACAKDAGAPPGRFWIRAARLGPGLLFVAIATCAFSAAHFTSVRLRVRAALQAGASHERLLARSAEFDVTGEADLDLGLYDLARARPERAAERLRRSKVRLANVGTDVALGNAHAALADNVAAKADYEHALARNPGSLKARLNLAEIDRRLGLLGEARSHAETARRIAPFHPKLLDLLDRLSEEDVQLKELEGVDVDDDIDSAR